MNNRWSVLTCLQQLITDTELILITDRKLLFARPIVLSAARVIGGTKDEKFDAFDKSTGKLLWQFKLDAGGYATPCTYSVKGRQYLAIAAGGGGKLGTKSGDSFVALALPNP